jgi:hypothetical protein
VGKNEVQKYNTPAYCEIPRQTFFHFVEEALFHRLSALFSGLWKSMDFYFCFS